MLEYVVLNKFTETVYFSFYTPKCGSPTKRNMPQDFQLFNKCISNEGYPLKIETETDQLHNYWLKNNLKEASKVTYPSYL